MDQHLLQQQLQVIRFQLVEAAQVPVEVILLDLMELVRQD
jgi:hypothetical protein